MITRVLLVVFFLLTFNLSAQTATKPSGSGTSSDPYLIATLENLYWLTQTPSEWTKVYKQTADIDASSSSTWDLNLGLSPIGNNTSNFSGTFDGNGHITSSIFINRPDSNYIGLFGKAIGATIKNLGVTNVNVTGKFYVGALIGEARKNDTISYCFSTGSVTASNNTSFVRAGGLIGSLGVGGSTYCIITNCYSTASVSGYQYIGGLVGQILNPSTTISNSYSTGLVTATTNSGGLIGNIYNNATATNSFWDTQTSGQSTSAAGTGKTTAEMKTQSTYTDWDFTNTWTINSGVNNGYPSLLPTTPTTVTIAGNAGVADALLSYSDSAAKTATADISGNYSFTVSYNWSGTVIPAKDGYTFSPSDKTYANITTDQTGQNYTATQVPVITAIAPSGSGTLSDPYLIATLNNLYWITQNTGKWASVYKQTADIDASSSNTWDAGKGFMPIGSSSGKFSGTYDGNGHIINGIYINRPDNQYIGLFGTTFNAVIKNLGVTNVNLTGNSHVGGLIGASIGLEKISNCFSTGTIISTTSGYGRSGGLIGAIGLSTESSVSNCYSITSVTGNVIGGLIGQIFKGTVSDCYSAGLVGANQFTGGLIGYHTAGTISNSFWDTQTSGQSSSAGGTGKTTAEMKTQSTYTDWDFTNTWTINPGVNNGYPSLLPSTPTTVTIAGNTSVGGTILSYTDGTAKTATADSTGKYSFTVSYNWSGTVTPAKDGYTFSPVNKSYTNIISDQSAQDYIANALSYSISGNAGVGGTILSYTDGIARTATADSTGKYSFTVSYNWSGTVTPAKDGYTFSPENKSYTNIIGDQFAQDYIASALSYSISGNAGVGGTVLSYTDGTAKTATADSTGKYSFTVSYNWSGTVTPAKDGYTFSPENKSYTNIIGDQFAQDYIANALSYSISGNAGVGGTILSYTDGTARTATADSTGHYSFAVSYNWSGTVIPAKDGYTFSPANKTYANTTTDLSGQDYTATALTYSISGNAGVGGTILSYTDGTARTATADSTGTYSFPVSYNWSGTVTPTKAGYTFSPVNKTYTNITAHQSGQNYTPAAVTLVITGKAGVAGAKLSYIDGSAKIAAADSTGKYSFSVSYNWSGTVTPTKEGYIFSPANKAYTKVITDQTGQNYTATLITYTISGNVGTVGAVLFRTNSPGKVVSSDASGNYSFTVPYNWSGTVTPTKEGFTFSPTDKTYSNIKADQQNQNYSTSPVSGIDGLQSVIPQNYIMYQNYPNPFNPSTVIRYGLPREGNVRIIIYDVLGKEVQTLFDGFKKAGYYEVSFDAGRLASGMYIYRIEAESFHETKKMLLTK